LTIGVVKIYIEAMKDEKILKLQAWLDGQMPARESVRVAEWVETDSEARELIAELRDVKMLLQVGEKPLNVEDSRECYWDQISRRIDVTDVGESQTEVVGSTTWMEWCKQWLVPVGGLAAIVVMLATVDTQSGMVQPSSEFDEKTQTPSIVEPLLLAPAGQTEPGMINSEGDVLAEDVNVLNLNVPVDADPKLQPGMNDQIVPSIENPER